MKLSFSLLLRAILAVLLTVGFYGLALGVAAALLYAVYAEFTLIRRINIQITLAALVGAATILWAILPRRQRFQPPGPRLLPENEPHLFKEVERIAALSGQKAPAQIYLTPDVNAFVTETGGFLGFGRKRVMGIGLALLQVLTLGQLRAVLAHEFGHYYGGDTAVGPWIYRTRQAIGRTVYDLSGQGWLQAPFRWYGLLFLRITQAISRQQELTADRQAGQVAGVEAQRSALLRITAAAPAFHGFMENEYAPLVEAGFRVPLAEGFGLFLNAAEVSRQAEKVLEEARQEPANPYDSHPSLKERLEALKLVAEQAPSLPGGEEPALSILADPTTAEKSLLDALLVDSVKAAELKPLTWAESGQQALPLLWKRNLERFQPVLAGLTLPGVGRFIQSPPEALAAILTEGKAAAGAIPPEQLRPAAAVVGAMWASLHLVEAGWQVETGPGEPITLRDLQGQALQPFSDAAAVATDKLAAAEWEKKYASREQKIAS